MKKKLLVLSTILLISGFTVAAPPEHRGKGPMIPEAREINSNRQSYPDSNRGLERAEERHDLKNEEYGTDDYRRDKPPKMKKHDKEKKPRHHKKKDKERDHKPR